MAITRIIYGSTTGNTQQVAGLIKTILADAISGVLDVAKAEAADFESADALILGVSTWDNGELQQDWRRFLPKLDEIDLSGKTVALFGLGDAQGFSGLYVNALRTLYDKICERGAKVVGRWPVSGYEFRESHAVVDGAFVGLVIDQENQSGLTVQRIGEWVAQIKPDLARAGGEGPPASAEPEPLVGGRGKPPSP